MLEATRVEVEETELGFGSIDLDSPMVAVGEEVLEGLGNAADQGVMLPAGDPVGPVISELSQATGGVSGVSGEG